MFRDILIPLDGSRFAEAPLSLASRLARLAQARLHLLLAHEPMPVLVGVGEAVPLPSRRDEARRKRESAYLIKTASGLRQANALAVGFRNALGPAGPQICEEAGRLDADLVVMATHGRGAIRRIWLGSVADYVVRHLFVPTLLVRPDTSTADLALDGAGRGILVALDLSTDAEAILEPVIDLARLTEAHVTLMHVAQIIYAIGRPADPSPIVGDAELLEASRSEAARRLERVAERLRELGLRVATRVVTGVKVAGRLLDALAEDRYDVIALTTQGRGGLRRLVRGSVADKVIRGAAKPVLVLRPHSPIQAEG